MERNWVVTVWGVRGAVPRAEADFKEYGGNTSCICADCGGELVVFDAGSGIVRLGEALAQAGPYLNQPYALGSYPGPAGFFPAP